MNTYERGDIVFVYFDLPKTDNSKPHPAIILSNTEVYNADELYICAMMTSSEHIDMFSFEVNEDMLVKASNKKFSQVRCHLISYIQEKHFCNARPFNHLKEYAVDNLVNRIKEICLSK
jgi:mRNA interferase MazF